MKKKINKYLCNMKYYPEGKLICKKRKSWAKEIQRQFPSNKIFDTSPQLTLGIVKKKKKTIVINIFVHNIWEYLILQLCCAICFNTQQQQHFGWFLLRFFSFVSTKKYNLQFFSIGWQHITSKWFAKEILRNNIYFIQYVVYLQTNCSQWYRNF